MFLQNYCKTLRGWDLQTVTLLDIGCGSGEMLDFFISKGFSPQNLTGIDLSETRICRAQKQHKSVNFIKDDALTFSLKESKFDMVTAFDLFSHLSKKEQILQGLSNVYIHLEKDGVFLWYDIYSKDHFSPAQNADSWGFNKEQMIHLCKETGFEVIYYNTFFKHFFNRYHSVYQVKRLSPGIVNMLEKILPGIPGNVLLAFKKI